VLARASRASAGSARTRSDPDLRGLKLHEKNRLFYARWHSRPARDIVAYHRRVGREIREALRDLPPGYFAKRVSPLWPNDLIGHSAEHRRRHLETTVRRRVD
jgi:hypothetical protein